jgi:RNA polymerase sigma-70 factor (ECF subfamily)
MSMIDVMRTPDGDEARLLARVRAGDAEARDVFVRAHAGRMLATARRFLRSEHDAADAVQDAFLSAFRSMSAFEGAASPATWLHRIVVNACLMKLRARARRRTAPLGDLPAEFADDGRRGRPWEAAHARLDRAETRAWVRAGIDRVPEPYRTVLLLRDIEQLDTDETARRLGITAGAVKTRLHRARQALRPLLEPHFIGGRA